MTRNQRKHRRMVIGGWVLAVLFALSCFAVALLTLVQAEEDHFREPAEMIEPEIVIIEDEPVPTACEIAEMLPDEAEMEMLSRLVEGEGGCLNAREQAWIVECVFHRVDSPAFPNTITEVVTQDKPCKQFEGYRNGNPISEDIHDIVVECWNCWTGELGCELPEQFLYFHAEKINGEWHNVFTTRWDYWNGGERWCPVWD